MGPEELVLCLQQETGAVLFPWSKPLSKYPHVSPLMAGARLKYFFFQEMLRFFDCLTLSPRCSSSTFHARKLCNLISAQQETETSSRGSSSEAAGSWSQNEFLLPHNLGEVKSLKARGVWGDLTLHQGTQLPSEGCS